MTTPDQKFPGEVSEQTGAMMDQFHVAPVSFVWLERLVEIDSRWNPKSWSRALFERELSNPLSRVRGLFVATELVGYLIAHVVCDEAHIVSFGVTPKWRGRGGGRLLLTDFIRTARVESIRSVSLDVRVSNVRARVLYERNGFSVVGLRRNYYSDNNEDALTMRLAINGDGPSRE